MTGWPIFFGRVESTNCIASGGSTSDFRHPKRCWGLLTASGPFQYLLHLGKLVSKIQKPPIAYSLLLSVVFPWNLIGSYRQSLVRELLRSISPTIHMAMGQKRRAMGKRENVPKDRGPSCFFSFWPIACRWTPKPSSISSMPRGFAALRAFKKLRGKDSPKKAQKDGKPRAGWGGFLGTSQGEAGSKGACFWFELSGGWSRMF